MSPRRVKTREAMEVVRLRKKKAQRGLGPIEGARLRRLTKRVDKGLGEVVGDIRREDP